MEMWHSFHQGDLINPLGLRVQFERVIDFPHYIPQRSKLFIRHFCVIEKMPLRLDEQVPNGPNFPGAWQTIQCSSS